jgi:hypothetical protein
MSSRMSTTGKWTLLLLVTVLISASVEAQGFGRLSKKTAKLTRVHPPEVFLPGNGITVNASTADSRDSQVAEQLRARLESALLGNEPRLKLEPGRPDVVIDVTITQNDYSDRWENRQMTERYKTGRKDSKGRDVYAERKVSVKYKIVNHSFTAAFRVTETGVNRTLLADTLSNRYQKDFQEGRDAPTPENLVSASVAGVVTGIADRITRTRETFGVLLPRGTLETAVPFAEAGLWDKYRDALESMPPGSRAHDESYRQYAIGVAYEALGYGAEDVDTTLKYLEQAFVYYNGAVDTNPKEAYFTRPYEAIFSSRSAQPPIQRVQSALVQYQKLKEFEDAGGGAGLRSTGAKGDASAGAAAAVDNAAIVAMLRAGLADDIIITSIETAPRRALDVSPTGLIELSKAGASKTLIERIQKFAR